MVNAAYCGKLTGYCCRGEIMKKTYYEVHLHENQKIPFIYRKNVERTNKGSVTSGWHPAVEISRCVSGSGRIICNGISYDFNENDIFVIGSNVLHSIVSESHLVFDCLIIDESFFADVDINVKNLNVENSIKDETILDLFAQVEDAFFGKKEFYTARLQSCVLNLVLYICDNYVAPADTIAVSVASSIDMIKIVIGYINAHLTEKITLDILARETGLSKYHLCHEFKKVTKHTIVTYIHICRCKKAAKLLKQNGYSVHDACFASGFENLSYFTSTFKKHFGMSPSAYKRD